MTAHAAICKRKCSMTSPFHCVCREDATDAALCLLDVGASVGPVDGAGRKALHAAAEVRQMQPGAAYGMTADRPFSRNPAWRLPLSSLACVVDPFDRLRAMHKGAPVGCELATAPWCRRCLHGATKGATRSRTLSGSQQQLLHVFFCAGWQRRSGVSAAGVQRGGVGQHKHQTPDLVIFCFRRATVRWGRQHKQQAPDPVIFCFRPTTAAWCRRCCGAARRRRCGCRTAPGRRRCCWPAATATLRCAPHPVANENAPYKTSYGNPLPAVRRRRRDAAGAGWPQRPRPGACPTLQPGKVCFLLPNGARELPLVLDLQWPCPGTCGLFSALSATWMGRYLACCQRWMLPDRIKTGLLILEQASWFNAQVAAQLMSALAGAVCCEACGTASQ